MPWFGLFDITMFTIFALWRAKRHPWWATGSIMVVYFALFLGTVLGYV